MLTTTKRICEKCNKTFEVLESYKGNNICLDCQGAFDKDKPTEIVIKPEVLDLSNVQEGKSETLFRPTSFNEYIGQEKAKERVQCYIDGCKKFNDPFPHLFISAPAGCGKTVFANITANLLDRKFVCTTAGEIKSEQQLVDKIIECESGILFLDEAHRISNKIGTFLLPILEEWKISGKQIKPFIAIFATTHKGNLSENLSALIQRFLPIDLENYKEDELVQILKQFIEKQYPNENVDEEIILKIAKNCKFTPRIGLSFLREFIYTKDWERVKHHNNIIQNGLTYRDIKVLKYIQSVDGAGKSVLAKFLRVEPKTYEFEIEPFLMFKELITVSNKRKLTEKGKLFLQQIEKGN